MGLLLLLMETEVDATVAHSFKPLLTQNRQVTSSTYQLPAWHASSHVQCGSPNLASE